jgi:hypothetical protein
VVLEKDGEVHLDRFVRNGVLHRVRVERNILHRVKGMKAKWIGYIWRRNCLLKHFIEGKIERRMDEGKTRRKA